MEKFNNFINGKYEAPTTGVYFRNLNPADESDVIGEFADSAAADVQAAVNAAQKAFATWRQTPAPQRGDIIYKCAQLLLDQKEDLAKVIVREMGKNLASSRGDIQSSADCAFFMAGEGRRLYGQTTYSALDRRWALTKRVPVGVCGLITAWNAPMAIITWKLFPALVCGNTVVLKPSEDSPLTAHMLSRVLKQAGIPDGVVNIVYGKSAVGEAIVKHNDVVLISFTGSSKVGRTIAEECGRQLKKCSLELGGKNGVIIMDDANIPEAAKAVVQGAFSIAGQRCASTSRAFVHETVFDGFMKAVVDLTSRLKVGYGHESDVCPIINRRQCDRIMDYIEKGKAEGFKLLYGGRKLKEGGYAKGCFIEPTIFVGDNLEAAVAQEEIFGPVLVIFKIRDFEDGIKKHNAVSYGLTAAIFTSDVNLAMLALEKMEAGCCYVNAPTFGSEPHMPFGGVKQSGIGTREPGPQAIDVFSECKTIYIDYSMQTQNSQFKG